MEVGVLGPLTIDVGGHEPHLARQERTILTRLALAAGRGVSDDALVDVLWRDEPPAGVWSTLQGYVHRLRRAVGAGSIERCRDGYVLGPGWRRDVDVLDDDQDAASRAEAVGDLAGAAELLVRALARFRGEPYAELGDADPVHGERRRLDEIRRRLAERLVEVELTRGRHADVVARLELVVDADPTDERAWSQLVRALNGCGRHADALAAAARARHMLAVELGIEPGPMLRAAERDVLDQRLDLPASGGNLPFAVDSFIGRDVELVAIGTALGRHRLVTLVGAGGAGKTRLATEAARASDVPGGAWLVELAAIGEPAHVADALAAALGAGGGLDGVSAAVAGREVLLLVDNCEHVLGAVADAVAGVLRSSPTVRILATSRERLHLRGEHVIDVRPLDPSTDAMALLLDRAEAASSTFDRAGASLEHVAAICRRLDGLPLALEIAAAQLRWLSLPELVARLDRRFGSMSIGVRDIDDRQRTLDAVIAWSAARLDDVDQLGLCRLAIFPDSFSLPAAEALLGDSARLARLVDASLVAVSPAGQQPRRYSMLAIIREYFADRRDALGETDDARRRLLAWAAAFVGDVEAAIRTPQQDGAMLRASVERLNLAAALETAEVLGEWTVALRIAAAVPLARPAERERSISRLLDLAVDAPPAVRARALATLANLAVDRDDAAATIAAAVAYREAAAQDGDEVQQAWAVHFLILGHWAAGHLDAVPDLLRQGLAEFDALGLADGGAHLHWIAALVTDDLVEAGRHADMAAGTFRDLGMSFGLAHALEAAALIDLRAARRQEAGVHLHETLSIFSAAGEAGCTAHCLETVAALAVDHGCVTEAADLLGAADVLRRSTGHGHRVWEAHGHRRAVAALDAAGVTIPDDEVTSIDEAARRALEILDGLDHLDHLDRH